MSSPRISSPLTKILWAGWESNTLTLQNQGWQLSAEQSMESMNFRFALKHPNFRMYGISQMIPYYDFYDVYQRKDGFSSLPPIIIVHMVSRMEINLYDDLSKMQPIDALPTFVENEKKDIEDFMIFRPIGKSQEIIVSPQEVPELLNMIIKKQSPKQAELREKKRKAWRKFAREVNEAQVINYDKIEDNRNDIIAQLIAV